MKRREFITLLGCGAVAWPLAARAQQNPPRVGLLPIGQACNPYKQLLVEAFRKGLREARIR